MKALFLALNASYSHTSLAVRSICEYIKKYLKSFEEDEQKRLEVDFTEYTINQPVGEVVRGISESKADIVLFATYIWNAEYVCKIIPDIKKILPTAIVCAGGPEFGYAPEKYFKKLPSLDYIFCGEGELVVSEFLVSIALNKNLVNFNNCKEIFKLNLSQPTIISKSKENEEYGIYQKENFQQLDELAFPYPELKNLSSVHFDCKNFAENKIFYYESSRGCPYKCMYCLSSVDTRVRFKSLEKVYEELNIFLNSNVSLVKFVDRTYNLDPQRYIQIWKYILKNHNGKTMFHFEIEAEYLTEEALDFLQSVPAGVMQFEIGVQSANKKTLKAINRSDNIEKLAENIKKIPPTIHQHLDLIAALPYEDLESFGKSFDFVMNLKPDALQLGFLKILHGTKMEQYAKDNNWKWMENPVYESYSTPDLSYEDILFLKDVEILVDVFYNKENFSFTINYLFRFINPWYFFSNLAIHARKNHIFEVARRETFWYEFLFNCIKEDVISKFDKEIAVDLLRYDFVRRGKQGGFPSWYEHRYNKEKHRELLENDGGITNARLDFAHSEYETFNCNVLDDFVEKTKGNTFELLIRYKS